MSAAADGLPHFGGGGFAVPRPLGSFRPLLQTAAAADDPSPAETRDDTALAEARQEFESLRAADQADFERRLADRERQLGEEIAGALAGQLAGGLAQVSDAIADAVAEVLGPFLAGAVRERALGELRETVAGLLANGGAVRVKLRGPADLTEQLGAVAAAAGAAVDIEAADGPELAVVVDDTLIETAMTAWMDRLRAAIDGAGNG